ncbi:MAG TPA: carbon monoxide dehydrogenase, partial [Humibacillus xanthopallidus]|nr:carbon monoxide dehydrogenase [Humibacillus xanthopallidus]
MLSGVTRKMAGQFFAALDADIAGLTGAGLTGGAAELTELTGVPGAPGATGVTAPAGTAAVAPAPRSYAGRASQPGESALEGSRGFALGVVAGGVIALLGVALGARLGRRR